MSYFSSTSGGSSIISGNLTITGDLDVQGDTTLVDTTTSGKIIFDTGVAGVGANYEIMRNADGTNRMQYNIPTGTFHEFSVNDATAALISSSAMFINQVNNLSSGDNSAVALAATGTTVSRNIADANTCLIVDQVHASSTGNILEVNFSGANRMVVTDLGELELTPVTITSSSTDDYALSIARTLNDSGAAGGSDVFRLVKGEIVPTDVTGWDNVYYFDFINNGSSQCTLDDQGVLQLFSTDRSQNVQIFHNNTDTSIRTSTGAIRLERSSGGHMLEVSDSSTRVTPDTITSGGTDDFGLSVEQTLNDSGAAGGNDNYTSLKTNITPTDVTGWDNIYLFDFQYGGSTMMQLSQTNASLNLSSLGASDFSINVANQGAGNDDPGRSLSFQGGAGGSQTTGGAGGDLNITGGPAQGSGDNNGGNVVITPGGATGSGQDGVFQVWDAGQSANFAMQHDATDVVMANSAAGGGWSFQDSGFNELFFFDGEGVVVSPQVQTSGSPSSFTVTGPAHTSLDASTEAPSVSIDLAATVQFSTGALGTQRAINVRGPTYAFVGASTISEAATFYIDASPVAGTNATITNSYSVWVDAGTTRLDGRVLHTQGADVASANDVTLGDDGNVFEITGTTTVNRIVNTGWQNGSQITLLFTSNPTITHGNATGGANVTILLAGASDFSATAGDTLTLLLCEIGGTQAWREIGRAAI